MALPSLLALPGRLRRLLSLFPFRFSFLLLILGLLSSPLARAQNYSPEQRQWLAQHPEIRVGATEMPNLLMRDFRSGSYSGLSVDMLKLYEQRLGVRFQMVYYGSLEDMHDGIRNREVDLLFAAVHTPGRETYLSFPKPYAELETKIIVRQETLGTGPLTLDQLEGRKVAVLAGSALVDRLRREYPGLHLAPSRDELSALTKLAFSEVDAAVTDLGRVTYYVQKEGLVNLAVGGNTGINYAFTFGVRGDWPELTALMDQTAAAIPAQEKEQVLQRWLRVGNAGPWNNPNFWWVAGGLLTLVAAALGVILFWNRTLRQEVATRTAQLDAQMAELLEVDRDLRESEARFRDLAELSYDWYWEQDENCRFTMMSGGAFQKGRLPLEQYLGKTRWELPLLGVTPEQMTAHRAQQEAHLPFRDFTYQIVAGDGEIHWYVSNGRPVFDERGQFRGYRGTGQDITARMRTQQALIDSEQRIRGLLDSTFSFVGLMDPQGTLLEANRTSLEFAGAAKEEVVGRPFWDTPWWDRDSDSRETLRQAVARARQGETVRFAASHRTAQGILHWIDVSITPVRDEHGRVIYLIPEGRDVTEMRRTQEALRALVENTATVYGEAFLDSLVQHVATLFDVAYAFVGEVDPDGCHIRTLSSWTHGAPSTNFAYALDGTPCQVMLGSGPTLFPRGITELFPDNRALKEMKAESYMGAPITGNGGKILGLLVVIDDKPLPEASGYLPIISLFALRAGMEMERMAQERAMRSLNQELERRVAERTDQLAVANKELEAFSYSVSHDLRAPLRHVSGFVSLLEADADNRLSEASRRYLNIITEAANRMGDLIDGLLAFSRIGRAEVHKTPVDLNKLLQEVIDDLAQEPHAPAVDWAIGSLPQVLADRTLIRQVLANLVGNALKYSRKRERAQIHIAAESGEHEGRPEWVIRIADNGVGFNMKYVGKLFGVFQRLHGAADFEGTGIGLANVRRVVERHGGRTWAEAEPDRGATFYFSLPRDE